MNKVTPQDSPANAYVELGVVRLRSVESVTNSKINGDLEQIMLENDKAAPNRSISSLQPQHPLDDSHPVLICVALPRMLWKMLNCSWPVCWPPATRQSLVSKGPPGPVVQMIGRRPMAFEIARTRLSEQSYEHTQNNEGP